MLTCRPDNPCFARIHIKAAVPEGPAGKQWTKQRPSIWGCSSRVLTGDGWAETDTISLVPPGMAWLQPSAPHSFNGPAIPSCLALGQHHPQPPAAWGHFRFPFSFFFPFPFPLHPVPSHVTIAQMLWDMCECSWILAYAYGTCPKE